MIDATGKYVLPGCDRPAHAPRHALRRHGHDRRRRVGPDRRGLRRDDDATSTSSSSRQGATFAEALDEWRAKAERQAGDRHGLPHGGHRPDGGRHARGARARCPDEGITSYKLFMAYKGALMVDDETLFRTMEVAAETGALVMVHAENGDAIDVLVKRGARSRATRSRSTTRSRGRRRPRARRRTARSSWPGSPARRSTSSTSRAARRSSRSRSRARRAGTSTARPARSTSSTRLRRPRAAGLRGREVRLLAAVARQGEPGRALERGAHRRRSRRSRPTTARSSGTARRRWARTTSRRSRTAGPGSRTGCR